MDIVPDADVEAVEAVDGVFLTQGAVGEDASVQHFVIEPGASVPEHDHPHEQVGAIIEGALTFLVDGEELVVEAGDTYAIPGGEPHAARNDGDETVVGYDIFSPPRANPDWKE
ncbi:cupin domain-containing protein [Halorubrum sp. SD626R]|uniref:cupin domain-containing protein n=1 Tax=Halorubrum sp. SD626R TaxID=1419722 RepID=UPI000A57EAE3|nr:cupin domain-containing protein [Halorubrum sp. SD626R]TKX80658.1 cupin domain-containing protein [Halorubrum sp. SD626R]